MIIRRKFKLKDEAITLREGYSVTARKEIVTYWLLFIPVYKSERILFHL